VDYLLVCIVALVAGGLTLFTGFGLGTLLLPALLPFFPPPVAVAATAIVHLANNLFKLALVGKWADWAVAMKFGLPAIGGAAVGAALLDVMAGLDRTLASFEFAGASGAITPVGLMIGLLVAAFAVVELANIERAGFARTWLPLGGGISGFFGGVSGHQGALRSAFLISLGLDKNAFIGTAAVCSTMVDVTRLLVYVLGAIGLAGLGGADYGVVDRESWSLVAAACVAAFAGSFVGSRLVKKITLSYVRRVVGAGLLIIGLAMAAGLL